MDNVTPFHFPAMRSSWPPEHERVHGMQICGHYLALFSLCVSSRLGTSTTPRQLIGGDRTTSGYFPKKGYLIKALLAIACVVSVLRWSCCRIFACVGYSSFSWSECTVHWAVRNVSHFLTFFLLFYTEFAYWNKRRRRGYVLETLVGSCGIS